MNVLVMKMRFNSQATLLSISTSFDEYGSPVEVQKEREVMVNVFNHSGDASLAARAQGLRLEAVLQLRSCDYHGEERCIFRDKEYEIETPNNTGEFTRLTLVRRLNNE